jgi:hypothetical protein
MTRIRTGFPFHLPIHDQYREAAKHLTTSPTMLTAAKAIGKSNRGPISPDVCYLFGRLLD